MQKAKLEADVYKRQLDELRPKRKQIEDACVKTYDCKISDLPQYRDKLEKDLESLVDALEEKIKNAKMGVVNE
jgi:DNA repair ATPase RecN